MKILTTLALLATLATAEGYRTPYHPTKIRDTKWKTYTPSPMEVHTYSSYISTTPDRLKLVYRDITYTYVETVRVSTWSVDMYKNKTHGELEVSDRCIHYYPKNGKTIMLERRTADATDSKEDIRVKL